MKSYEDISERVFKKGDEILKKKQKRTAIIKRTSLTVSGVCAVILISFGVWKNNDIKNALNSNWMNDKQIITENKNFPETTTGYIDNGTSPSVMSTASGTTGNSAAFSTMTTLSVTSKKNKTSENTVTCTTALDKIYSVSTSQIKTKEITDKKTIDKTEVNTAETRTEITTEKIQTTVSTAIETNSTETNTTFLTETMTTSETSDDERSIYMKKLTSFFTSAVVLAASATPIIGNAEYNIDTSRYFPGEKAIFAKMDSGELDVDIDGNGIIDAYDGYLLKYYDLMFYNQFNRPDVDLDSEIVNRIETIADYNEDGKVDGDDVSLWVRYFIVSRKLKMEYFEPTYYNPEYIDYDLRDMDKIKFVPEELFIYKLGENMHYLQASYDVVADMYEKGIIDLDFNGNGQLDIGDIYEFYVYHYLSGYTRLDDIWHVITEENTYIPDEDFNRCEEAYEKYPQNIACIGYSGKDDFMQALTHYIVEHIEMKPEYLTEEYYQKTYGSSYYRPPQYIISSRIRDAAARLGLIINENAWLDIDENVFDDFFTSYCNDIENGLRSVPDVNMDGVVDYKDYFVSNIYLEDLLNSRTADESILPEDIWNNLAENCDFNGNGTSKDIYDILTVQIYVVKYVNVDDNFNFKTAYNEYVNSLGGISTESIEEFSYENNLRILSNLEKSDILYGDANLDGKVTIADATAIIQSLGNQDEYALSEQGAINADVIDNGDGVTGADANAIEAISAGFVKQTDFPMTKAQLEAAMSE